MYANKKQMIKAAEMTVSVTRRGANFRSTQGTTFQPARSATAKKATFFNITIPKLTSPPTKLKTKASKMMTRTSSITAAPRMVVPSLDFSFPISFNACTEMLTLVADRRRPRKIA
ncbi:hypothetical protein D3C76_1447920 [compost metagenome]